MSIIVGISNRQHLMTKNNIIFYFMPITRLAMLVLVTQSCLTVCDPMDCSPPGSSVHEIFSRQGYWSVLPFPSPGDLPNPGIEARSPALQADQLSHKGSPRILEWVAYPFSRGSSRPRDRIGVSCIAGGFFTN